MRTLCDLQCGECCRVKKVHSQGPLKRRFNDMGITDGSEVTLVRKAPLGDPLQINLRGCSICLRAENARQIEIYGQEAV
jgi:ferrous iron transport protein A